ncbi:hypothetical protein [Nonomuraea sp. NPDC023979]|uniref:hypothetical protein n=1 Tax=Nonomuraea sp. NPDC023979 TaxID=3154796 RepID=UPI0034050617
MPLQLDVVALGAPEVDIARRFYTTASHPLSPTTGDSVTLDLHGTGQVELSVTECLATVAGVT